MECPRCRQLNPDQARFCMKCGTALGRTCDRCATELPADAAFCFACGHPARASSPAPRFAAPEAYTPRRLAAKILTSRAALEGERKQVTVLFADMKGSMELIADRDPEEVRAILDPVLERMMDAVHRYEGTVNQVMGDGIMALFGAPLAHEDHAVRACRAALRMQDSVKRYGEEVRRAHGVVPEIRVGLNSGEVVVGSIGSDLRMSYTAIGQTTHLAARMEEIAAPGAVVISAETCRLAHGYVQVAKLGSVSIKGQTDPVMVYEVLGPGEARTRIQAAAPRELSRFVARDVEMEQLRCALESAARGRGQVIAVVGEPGVGKSRLLFEFTRADPARDWLVLASGGVSYGKATAYLPVVDLLKTYFEVDPRDDHRQLRAKVAGKLRALDRPLESALPALLALLDVPVEDPEWQVLDPAGRRYRTIEAVKRLLVRQSQISPLLVILEDLHWVDSETQAVLDSLVGSLPTARLLLVLNYRPEYEHAWGGRSYYTQLRLDPLPATGAAELLEGLLGRDPGLEPLERLLVQITDGNPLFLEETVRALVESGALVGTPGNYRPAAPVHGVEVPATVHAVLAARIDRLPAPEKELLQMASVVGKDVPFDLLRAMTGLGEASLQHHLEQLEAAEFLYETAVAPVPEYTFKHALTHEVAYGSLLGERRRALHVRALTSLEGQHPDRLDEHVEALAHHAIRGEVRDKAVAYLRRAGARAFARGAIAEAAQRYELALIHLRQLPETEGHARLAVDLCLDLHSPLVMLGRATRGLEVGQDAERMARRLDDRPRIGRLLHQIGYDLLFAARYEESMAYSRRTLEIATDLRQLGLGLQATRLLGLNHLARAEYPAAIQLLGAVTDHQEADPAPTALRRRVTYIETYGWLAFALATSGDFSRAVAVADRAVALAAAAEHPLTRTLASAARAYPLLVKGDFAAALPACEEGGRLSRSTGFLAWVPGAYHMWGWALVQLGRQDEGLAYLREATELHEQLELLFQRSLVFFARAEGLFLSGRLAEAGDTARRTLDLARAVGERYGEALARDLLARIAAASDTAAVDSALQGLDGALHLAEEIGAAPLVARCRLSRGELLAGAGRRVEGEGELRAAATMFTALDMSFWLARARASLSALR